MPVGYRGPTTSVTCSNDVDGNIRPAGLSEAGRLLCQLNLLFGLPGLGDRFSLSAHDRGDWSSLYASLESFLEHTSSVSSSLLVRRRRLSDPVCKKQQNVKV